MRNFILALLFLLPACSVSPTKTQLDNADYGGPITEEHARVLAQQFLGVYLKYPESAVIEWRSYEKGWFKESHVHGSDIKYGYKLEARIKAKNNNGILTMYQRYIFMFKDDRILSAYAEETHHGIFKTETRINKIY